MGISSKLWARWRDSGNCVDGVCCNSACTGSCAACNNTGIVGTCSNIAAGLDPAIECGGFSCDLYYFGFAGDNCYDRSDAPDSAVADSVLPRGERVALAWAIADVYDWQIDFTRDVRSGDRVQVLFEWLESVEGEHRFGRVVAARVEVAGAPSYAFWFEPDSARGGFYDEHGRSLRRAFLRASGHHAPSVRVRSRCVFCSRKDARPREP